MKEFKKKLPQFGIATLLISGIALWCNDVLMPRIDIAQQHVSNDLIKAEMVQLADQGKSSAILWLASNYSDSKYMAQLDTQVAQNNSDAMMVKASNLYATNKSLALQLIQSAAVEGNPSAIKYLSDKKVTDIGLSKFLTEYLIK
ncbi:hypothetical protein AMD27_16335 (plasmid) [Acinetobacter sp. TGL-Y2]|uniref:hypothetical protein n=1 Tax=Acinetobacter sp. TGL-Y2 TaxID=1407071 RepID=UPI0007A6801D|nr:hypothetical protein [Acinetobacter sp. TGL-Y2]AMW80485.1 hypothetical protein AMD27_16335 [Acinetobacter sp. TGL-Y2]